MSRVRMPPWPRRDTVRRRRRLAREQPRQQQVGGGRLGVGAAGRQAEHGRPAHAAQPQHRARVRRDTAAHEPPAHPPQRDEERVPGSVDRPPAVRTTSTASAGPRRQSTPARSRRGRLVGARTRMRPATSRAPPPCPGRSRSKRARSAARSDSLTSDRRPASARTARPRPAAAVRSRRSRSPASTIDAGHDVRGDLHRRDELARRTTDPSSAVNTSSGSIRSSRSTSRDRTWSTPRPRQ